MLKKPLIFGVQNGTYVKVRDLLKKELRRLDLRYNEKEIVASLDYENFDALSEALGTGQISVARVADTLSPAPDEVQNEYAKGSRQLAYRRLRSPAFNG